MIARVVTLAAVLIASSGPAGADEPALRGFIARAQALVEAAVAARQPRPPVAIKVEFRDRRLAALDLGAPLLAAAGADLDGDGRAELALLTTTEVIVLRVERDRASVIHRRALAAGAASVRPRDPVGAIGVVARDEPGVALEVRTSQQATASRVALDAGQLSERAAGAGFPLCGGRVELAPGRNYFTRDPAGASGPPPLELPAEFVAAHCFAGLVDRQGRALAASATVDLDGRLVVACRGPDGPCPTPVAAEPVGYAIAITDLDRDGQVELVTSRGVAPGELDEVQVVGLVRGASKVRHRRRFHGGVVGVVAAPFDAVVGDDLVVATRFFGSTQVALWRLN